MDDLYAAVIHDVKNQLAELSLRLGGRKDAQAEMVVAIAASRRLSELLIVHRDESQLLSVDPDFVNPGDFLTILAAEFRELFPSLVIAIDADRAPAFAYFDDALVRMALANAIHNACHAAKSKVQLAAYEQDGMLVLEVRDDGSGYPESMLEAVGAVPSAVSGRGTGLGLYLARKIAMLHHAESRRGSIEMSNADGAVFRMLLP